MSIKHLAIAVCLVTPSIAVATPSPGDRVFSLSGSGTSDDDFDTTTFSTSIDLGYFHTRNLEYSVRQNITYLDSETTGTDINGATRVVADYHFGTTNLLPFVGASLGGIYGDNVEDTFTGGLEVGLKYYALEKTFVSALIDYQFFFDSGDEIDNNFDDGAVFYSLGIGFHF